MKSSARHLSVLVVEDDPSLASLLSEELRERGFDVRAAASAEDALAALAERPADLVVSDLRLPAAGGDALLAATRRQASPPAFIVITAYATVSQAVECLKAGADDFLTKPLDLEHLAVASERAVENRRLRELVAMYEVGTERSGFRGLLGRSRPMRDLFAQIRALARSEGPVLVLGESGVGKELVARAIHAESPRSGGRFLAVNCAGVPEALLESEFFGHTRGAFTGASQARRGLFDEADGGTLFLDEVAEMGGPLQAKLLRVLQDGLVRPLGANTERGVDVRVIAATNSDLEAEMRAGRFREDLFYRLETFQIAVPPLRDRGEDVDLLAAHFLRRHAERQSRNVRGLSPEALALLRAYPFPGNVRELENALERAVTFCAGEWIEPAHLPPRIANRPQPAERDMEDGRFVVRTADGMSLPTLDEVRDAYIRHVLRRVGGNKKRAASLLGIGRRTLYRRLTDGDA